MGNIFMKPLVGNDTHILMPNKIENGVKDENKHYVLNIENLSHTFDKGTEHEYKIFDNFSLKVEDKVGESEIISIMGGSGCGKSCLLRIAAGLMKPQFGTIRINGQTIDEYKSVPMVFQSYSSYEWMTVLENVALPIIIKGLSKKEANEKAMEMIKLVGLEQHVTKYAKSSVLSGGQLQRVSIARCLASGSKVFFLDEATGALDIKMKREIQDLILNICHNNGFERTIINVTHSVEEALYISDKIFVLAPNPCHIVDELDIDYGSQRGRWVFESDKYKEYSKHLNNLLDDDCK
jgi:NitT/TauT family transport system ATP-binding protein